MKSPIPTVDIIIEYAEGIVLIERKNPPHGWAIPGGFVDYGESLEKAAIREAKEETSLDVKLLLQLKTYSDPKRDPRHQTIATTFIAVGQGTLRANDDAVNAVVVREGDLPKNLVFDHAEMLRDYFFFKKTGKLPRYAD